MHWIVIYPVDSAIQLLNNWGLAWIVIYPVDIAIQLLNNWGLAPVVQKMDSAIHRINRYPVDKC